MDEIASLATACLTDSPTYPSYSTLLVNRQRRLRFSLSHVRTPRGEGGRAGPVRGLRLGQLSDHPPKWGTSCGSIRALE